jgi:integrase
MDEMATHGIPTTQVRCSRGFRSKAYDSIRVKPLVQTNGEDLLAVIHANGNCVAHYLRRLHNLALDLGWLPWPILAKRAWPKIHSQSKRAITAEEHAAVIASEKNPERRAYYELLYETGAAQTDAVSLTAEDIDWPNGVLVYRRRKLGPLSETRVLPQLNLKFLSLSRNALTSRRNIVAAKITARRNAVENINFQRAPIASSIFTLSSNIDRGCWPTHSTSNVPGRVLSAKLPATSGEIVRASS